jgi:hypothetical protein
MIEQSQGAARSRVRHDGDPAKGQGCAFENGLVVPVLRAQYLAFGETPERAPGRRGQGPLFQAFRARNVFCLCP